ncbi:MAG: class I fructose-bisphosphate aldolase [Acidimicrobiales bacterium]
MGKNIKLARLLPKGKKSLIVAMDQPRSIYSGPLADPAKVLESLEGADVDGYLLTLATAVRMEQHLSGRAVVVSVSKDYQEPREVVEQAVVFGASALKFEVFPNSERENDSMRGLEALAVHAERWGLPVMAEVVPGGFDKVELHSAQNLRDAVRRAAEAGADMAKIPPPSTGQLVEVTEYASVPVLLLGGARSASAEDMLARARELSPFVDGLVFGRYIVEDPDPASIVSALREVLAKAVPAAR